jgi:hypothetical protein
MLEKKEKNTFVYGQIETTGTAAVLRNEKKTICAGTTVLEPVLKPTI